MGRKGKNRFLRWDKNSSSLPNAVISFPPYAELCQQSCAQASVCKFWILHCPVIVNYPQWDWSASRECKRPEATTWCMSSLGSCLWTQLNSSFREKAHSLNSVRFSSAGRRILLFSFAFFILLLLTHEENPLVPSKVKRIWKDFVRLECSQYHIPLQILLKWKSKPKAENRLLIKV